MDPCIVTGLKSEVWFTVEKHQSLVVVVYGTGRGWGGTRRPQFFFNIAKPQQLTP